MGFAKKSKIFSVGKSLVLGTKKSEIGHYEWLGRKNATTQFPTNACQCVSSVCFIYIVDLLLVLANAKQHLGDSPSAKSLWLRKRTNHLVLIPGY